jgi:hypothetical protein
VFSLAVVIATVANYFAGVSLVARSRVNRRTTNCVVQSDDRTQHQKDEKVTKNLARALIAGAAFLFCARDYRARKYRDNQKRKGMK